MKTTIGRNRWRTKYWQSTKTKIFTFLSHLQMFAWIYFHVFSLYFFFFAFSFVFSAVSFLCMWAMRGDESRRAHRRLYFYFAVQCSFLTNTSKLFDESFAECVNALWPFNFFVLSEMRSRAHKTKFRWNLRVVRSRRMNFRFFSIVASSRLGNEMYLIQSTRSSFISNEKQKSNAKKKKWKRKMVWKK